MTTPGELARRLAAIVGPAHVLTDPSITASYETDWTGRFTGRASCVVRPADVDEVAAAVRVCAETGTPIVSQGGNTGLVGGSIPSAGEVLLSLTRLDHIGPVDQAAAQLTVGAGARLASVQRVARAGGLDVGVDFAARDSATIGGIVATNAGGERVLRYGTARAQVAGLEAVLADGSIVRRLAGLPKDNTGYDYISLLSGSEGTLAVITTVRLRLVPLLAHAAVALIGVADIGAAVEVLSNLRRALPDLQAAEFFFPDGLELVQRHAGLPPPLADRHGAYLLLDVAARHDPTDALIAALDDTPAVADATVAGDARGRQQLWSYRELHPEAINASGVPVKLDVAVPLGALPTVVAQLAGCVPPPARAVVFGHLAEGNLHINVLDAGEFAEQITAAVLHLVAAHGGSISAEHGVGRAKARWLPLSRSSAELAVLHAVKNAFDPRGLLNPGVLLT